MMPMEGDFGIANLRVKSGERFSDLPPAVQREWVRREALDMEGRLQGKILREQLRAGNLT